MLLVGILYIAFEKSALVSATSSPNGLAAPQTDRVSRILIGVQVRSIQYPLLARPLIIVDWSCCISHDRYTFQCGFTAGQNRSSSWRAGHWLASAWYDTSGCPSLVE